MKNNIRGSAAICTFIFLVAIILLVVGLYRNRGFFGELIGMGTKITDESVKSEPVGGLSGIIDLVKFYTKVAGFEQEMVYLVLLQNNAELRPTGGFIGTYGILKVRNGAVKEFTSDDSYNLDKGAIDRLKVEPPPPLKEYFEQEYWFLRDSNWSPDFETSAKQALWFYEQESQNDFKFDGVLAITPEVIKDLLVISGPVLVNEIIFTNENFVESLQKAVELEYQEKGLEKEERKEIINDIARALIPRVQDLKIQQFITLKDIILKNLKEKHILVYFEDEKLQGLARKNDWTGSIKKSEGDFLLVVDANLGAYKSDPFVKRVAKYSIRPGEANRLIGEVAITYNHQGELSWLVNRYRTYTRIYVPLESELIEVRGALAANESSAGRVDRSEEFDKTVFGAFTVVKPGESRELIFRYYLPVSIIRDSYSLLWQKQSGTNGQEIILDFDFGSGKKFYQEDNLDTDKFYQSFVE